MHARFPCSARSCSAKQTGPYSTYHYPLVGSVNYHLEQELILDACMQMLEFAGTPSMSQQYLKEKNIVTIPNREILIP